MPSIWPRRLATADETRLVAMDGRNHDQLLHRFQQMRGGLGQRLLHRNPSGQAEGEFAEIDAVVAAVEQCHGDIDDREAERAFGHRILDALFNRRDPLFGDRPAVDLLLELEAVATRQAGGSR